LHDPNFNRYSIYAVARKNRTFTLDKLNATFTSVELENYGTTPVFE